MNTPPRPTSERRREILAEMGQIPRIVDGTLTQRQRHRGRRCAAVYHQLQRWRGGRNDTRHIPAERVNAVQAGLNGYRRMQELVSALARLDEATILAQDLNDSKKKPLSRPLVSARRRPRSI